VVVRLHRLERNATVNGTNLYSERESTGEKGRNEEEMTTHLEGKLVLSRPPPGYTIFLLRSCSGSGSTIVSRRSDRRRRTNRARLFSESALFLGGGRFAGEVERHELLVSGVLHGSLRSAMEQRVRGTEETNRVEENLPARVVEKGALVRENGSAAFLGRLVSERRTAYLDTLALDVPLGLVKQRFEVGDLPLELNLFGVK
jgi:hypothetical protein